MNQTQTTIPPLTIRRTLEASRERVFDAWTQPEQMRQWFAPPGTSAKDVTADPRPGGAYRIAMQAADGEDFIAVGTYREVHRPDRLVYTMAWLEDDGSSGPQMLVTIDFLTKGTGTEMVFTQTGFASEESRNRHEEGWGGSFSQLPAVVESAR